jgi:hypothetical protein
MTSESQAVVLARLQTADGKLADRARVAAWDRLFAMLNALDSKTSALLRFVSGADPFAQSTPLIKAMGLAVGHISLVLSVASCGFAFPVIGVARGFFDGRPGLDDGVLDRLGRLVAQRTRLYLWAWRLAVAGGLGFAVLVALATIH